MTERFDPSDTLDTNPRVGAIIRAAAPVNNPKRPHYFNPFMALAGWREHEQNLAALTNRMVSTNRPYAHMTASEMQNESVIALGEMGLLRFESMEGKSYACLSEKLLSTLEERCLPKAPTDAVVAVTSKPSKPGFFARMFSVSRPAPRG